MNAKRGSLCRVVRNGASGMTPGLVDRIVEVLRPAVAGEQFISADRLNCATFVGDATDAWVVTSANPLPWAGIRESEPVGFYEQRIIGDEHLRPIGGVPVTDEIEDRVPA